MSGQIVYSSTLPDTVRCDLKSGRFMYDLAHWRSEFRFAGPLPLQVTRAPFPIADGPRAPNYAFLPARLASKAEAGDRLPPFRTTQDFYSATEMRYVEYLSRPDVIAGESHGVSDRAHAFPGFDTLMVATGGPLPTPGPDPATDRIVNPVMTRYRGLENGEVVFSGFDGWSWSRADCARLVDAVLTGMWGLTRTVDVRLRPAP